MRPRRARTFRVSFRLSTPPTWKLPASGAIAVESTRRSVLLPEPFGPIRPKTSPAATEKLTSETPRPLLLYRRPTFFASRAGATVSPIHWNCSVTLVSRLWRALPRVCAAAGYGKYEWFKDRRKHG